MDYGQIDTPSSPRGENKSPMPGTRYARGVSSDAEGIYTYAYRPSRDSDRSVIDVYDPADGTYQYSYDFPVDVRRAPYISNGRLYVVQDTSAFSYSFSQ